MLLILLFVLELALLLDAKLWFLSFLSTALIFFTGSAHIYFSFPIHDLLLNISLQCRALIILADNAFKDKSEHAIHFLRCPRLRRDEHLTSLLHG